MSLMPQVKAAQQWHDTCLRKCHEKRFDFDPIIAVKVLNVDESNTTAKGRCAARL